MPSDTGNVLVEGTYRVSQWLGSSSGGRHGIPCFLRLGGRDLNPSMYGFNPEELFGHRLAEGTKILVTIEVVEEGPELLQTSFPPSSFRGGIKAWNELPAAEQTSLWDGHEAGRS